jgi:hypothetical protein
VVLYIGAIHKRFANQGAEPPWLNTYHVNAATEDDALDVMESIKEIEREVHWNNIEFWRLSVRQASVLAGSGRQRAISDLGVRDAGGENFLPSFCTVRVVFTDLVNRPDQKYLRPMINENEQTSGAVDASLITLMETAYAEPLLALPSVVSSNGVPLTGQTVYPFVQNRQRNWHRRHRDGFKRGWVPV